MPNFKCIDLTGKIFGRLLVLERANERLGKDIAWPCICECGCSTLVRGACLRHGVTQSCGCLQKERASQANGTHRMRALSEYGRWQQAKNRCFSPAVKEYKYYGARGITMCEDWQKSFEKFFQDMGPCPSGMTLDRIDVNGNYEPTNCRWASRIDQARNTRDATYVEYQGERLHLKELAERIGIAYKTLHARHMRGQPLLAPLRRLRTRNLACQG